MATTDTKTHPDDASDYDTWQLTIRPAVPPPNTPVEPSTNTVDAAPALGGDAAVLSYSFHTCRLFAVIGPADRLDAMCTTAAAVTAATTPVNEGAADVFPPSAAAPLPAGCRALGGVLAGQRRGTPLELRVLLDASVLEVFALSSGEALTTRVNPPPMAAEAGTAAAAGGGGGGRDGGGVGGRAPTAGGAEGAVAGWAMSMGMPAGAAVREGSVREEAQAAAGNDGNGGGGAGVRVEWLRAWEMGSVWVAA